MIALTGLVLASCKEIFDFVMPMRANRVLLISKPACAPVEADTWKSKCAIECLVGVAVREWGSSAQLAKDRPVWTEESEKGAGS